MRRTALPMRAALALVALLSAASAAGAQGGGGLLPGANGQQQRSGGVTTCSARNAPGTKQCTTTCPAGQSADCTDADDGSEPSCVCGGG